MKRMKRGVATDPKSSRADLNDKKKFDSKTMTRNDKVDFVGDYQRFQKKFRNDLPELE
jgi:hypothetical protein